MVYESINKKIPTGEARDATMRLESPFVLILLCGGCLSLCWSLVIVGLIH